MSLKGSNPSPCLKALDSIIDNSRFVRVFYYQGFRFTGNRPSIETVLALNWSKTSFWLNFYHLWWPSYSIWQAVSWMKGCEWNFRSLPLREANRVGRCSFLVPQGRFLCMVWAVLLIYLYPGLATPINLKLVFHVWHPAWMTIYLKAKVGPRFIGLSRG